jgi:hypothetical protein
MLCEVSTNRPCKKARSSPSADPLKMLKENCLNYTKSHKYIYSLSAKNCDINNRRENYATQPTILVRDMIFSLRIDRGSMQIVEHQMISSPERKTIVT